MPSCAIFKVSNTLFLSFTKNPFINTGIPALLVALKATLLLSPLTNTPPSGKTSTLVFEAIFAFVFAKEPSLIGIFFS